MSKHEGYQNCLCPPRRGDAFKALSPETADFFRRARAGDGPAWRWNRAANLAALGERPDQLDDPATVAAWQLQLNMVSAREESGASEISSAHMLYVENGPRRWEVEAALLAGLTIDQVAERVDIAVGVVCAYANTFFDVVGRLHAGDWVWTYAVRVGPWLSSEPTEADVWRYVAATGGPVVLDLMVGDYLSLPESRHAERHKLADDIRTMVRFVATPVSNTRKFRGVMVETWRVMATRVTALDAAQWENLVGHMEVLEIVAGFERADNPVDAAAGSVGGLLGVTSGRMTSDSGS